MLFHLRLVWFMFRSSRHGVWRTPIVTLHAPFPAGPRAKWSTRLSRYQLLAKSKTHSWISPANWSLLPRFILLPFPTLRQASSSPFSLPLQCLLVTTWLTHLYIDRLVPWMHLSCYQMSSSDTTQHLNNPSIRQLTSWATLYVANPMLLFKTFCLWTTVCVDMLYTWRNECFLHDHYGYAETVDQYLNSFQWNGMKYRTDKSLQETTQTLVQVRKDMARSLYKILTSDI